MTDEDFRKVVEETIQSLPQEFRSQLDNVGIIIEDQPTNPYLLGLYQGVPKPNRHAYSALPDKITIFKASILHIARNHDDAKRIIRQTVLHEIGHHFGLSDAELARIERGIK